MIFDDPYVDFLHGSKDPSRFTGCLDALFELCDNNPRNAPIYLWRCAKLFTRFIPTMNFDRIYNLLCLALKQKDAEGLAEGLYYAARVSGTIRGEVLN